MTGNGSDTARPSCFTCLHFYVTHQPAHPYGCRAMGFKSAQLPVIAVHASSGLPCQLHAPKPKKNG
ncbi:MAG: uracil-DNA glycosylase [Desulfobacteraceae bacterium]|nr:uracil-DNA glycosylase [Desulfobacteraceae bacterium]